jgi:hypothetical protein
MHLGSLRTGLGRPLPRLSPHRAVGPYGECRPGSPTDLQKLGRALAPICEFPRAAIERARTFQCRNHSCGRHGTSNLRKCGSASSKLTSDSQALRSDIAAFQQASAMATSEDDLHAALEQRFKRDRSGACIAAAVVENGNTARAYFCRDYRAGRNRHRRPLGETATAEGREASQDNFERRADPRTVVRTVKAEWPGPAPPDPS